MSYSFTTRAYVTRHTRLYCLAGTGLVAQGRIQGGCQGCHGTPPPWRGGAKGGGAKGRCVILTKMTLENISDVPQICSGTLRIAPRALNFLHFLGGGPPNPPPPSTEGIGGEPLHQLCCQYTLLNKRNPYLTSVAFHLDFGNYNPQYLVPHCSAINLESHDGNHKRFAQLSTLTE